MARQEELDFMEKFGVCEDATNGGVFGRDRKGSSGHEVD